MNTEKLIEDAQKYLSSKKLAGFEVFCAEHNHLVAEVKNQKFESMEESTEIGFAVRVLSDHRLGFSYVTSKEERQIKDCVDRAVAASLEVEPDPDLSFAPPEHVADFNWKCNDEALSNIPIQDRVGIALKLEEAAISSDKRVRRVRSSSYEESKNKIHLVNSKGVDLKFENTIIGCDVFVIAEDGGAVERAWDFDYSHTFADLDFASVAKRAVAHAVSLLGSKSISTIRTSALLHPFVATSLLKILSKGFCGDNIYKKKSILAGRLGQNLYSPLLNIVNDGLLPNGYSSSPFDGEGHPSKKVYLVKEGKVENWLTDIYWGKKLGIPSTGSSVRDSVKSLPSIGLSNLYIEPSKKSADDLMKEMGKGFYITEIVGSHTINPITGEFSVGAEGFWVENGSVSYPVKGVMIAGNLQDMFKNVVSVGGDLRLMERAGSPHF